jgi:hypothetical protein
VSAGIVPGTGSSGRCRGSGGRHRGCAAVAWTPAPPARWGVRPGWAISFDRTNIYPQGGGQPADRGTLAGVEVVDVRSREAETVHALAERAAVVDYLREP